MKDKIVLVVDDDVHVRQLIEHRFRKEGAQVTGAANGREGLRQFYRLQPDLVILDIMMPETDGWETCRQIRMLSDVPLIMLTALNQNKDVIRGLDLGADDFVSKPFSPEVLLARARAALRRETDSRAAGDSNRYDDGYLSIDLDRHRVTVDGQPVNLTPKEYRLLAYLLENVGRVRTPEQILESVWGWAYQDSVEYVHVYISHLRRKLERDPRKPEYVITQHGLGYRFEKARLD